MFFLDTTPDTSSYMIAGYAIAFTLLAVYLVSLFVRWRNLSRDYDVLKSMEAENESKVKAQNAAAEAKTVKAKPPKSKATGKPSAKKKPAAKPARKKTTGRKK